MSNVIVSIHQPAYLPWLGYLDRIAQSDIFIFLDTVQFEKNSFTNRNRIKTAIGPIWLTVPVQSRDHLDRTLLDLKIDNRQNWKSKHLRSIEQNYRKALFFTERFPRLVALYDQIEDGLADFCFRQLDFWIREFDLPTKIVRASQMNVQGRKSDLVLSLCKATSASEYLSGPQGRGYLDEQAFAEADIMVRYHEFVVQPYPQLFGDFLPAMAALDYWLQMPEPAAFRRNCDFGTRAVDEQKPVPHTISTDSR